MTPETKVKNSICNYLEELIKQGLPLYFERRNATGTTYRRGISDIYILYDGKHYEVEFKAKNGELSADQLKWKSRCKLLKIEMIVVYSLEEFKAIFDTILSNKKK